MKAVLPKLPKYIFALVAMLWSCELPSRAQFTFTTNNGAITIVSYTGGGGAVIIPATTNSFPVTVNAPGAFSTKSTVTSVTIPDSVTSIGFNAFLLCKGLTNVVIGNSVTNIGSEAFDFCTNLLNIAIPDSVHAVGSNAFVNCNSLTNATMGSGVNDLGSETFDLCANLRAINVNAANPAYTSVSGVLFNKSQTRLIQYPAAKTGSGYVIPITVTNIEVLAFDGSLNLTGVTIPAGVISISVGAFNKCTNVTGFTLPNTVVSIGDQAFNACLALTSVTLPGSVTNIGNNVCAGCFNLTNITVGAANPAYSSLDGVLLDKARTRIIQFPEGKVGNYNVPTSVSNIGDNTFAACFNLTSVVMSAGVTNIGFAAFNSDYALTNVTIPAGVIYIGQVAFNNCTNLTTVTIPASVANLDNYAFFGCSALRAVYFLGAAPTAGYPFMDGGVFTLANPTIYYLPGTTNWNSSATLSAYASLTLILWNALAQTTDGSFGVRTNQFGFNITGTTNLVVIVEACTNLINPAWQPVRTNTLVGGTVYFSDPKWTNYSSRIYRLRSP